MPPSYDLSQVEKKLSGEDEKKFDGNEAARYLIWTIAFYVFFIDLMITLPYNLSVFGKSIKEALSSNEGLVSELSDLFSVFSVSLYQLPPWYQDRDTERYLVRHEDLNRYQDGDTDTESYLVHREDLNPYQGDILNWVTILRIIDFVCIGIGIWCVYRKNGGSDGCGFIQKFAVLSWVIGFRRFVAFILLRFAIVVFDISLSDFLSDLFRDFKYGKELDILPALIDILLILAFYHSLYKGMCRSIAKTTQSDSNQSAEAENA